MVSIGDRRPRCGIGRRYHGCTWMKLCAAGRILRSDEVTPSDELVLQCRVAGVAAVRRRWSLAIAPMLLPLNERPSWEHPRTLDESLNLFSDVENATFAALFH